MCLEDRVLWLWSVIPATQEAKAGAPQVPDLSGLESEFKGQPGQLSETFWASHPPSPIPWGQGKRKEKPGLRLRSGSELGQLHYM